MVPQVSVLMPVYNACSVHPRSIWSRWLYRRRLEEAGRRKRRFLEQAIESVLQQTFADFELVIVDDGSTDDTPAVLRSYAEGDPRIRVVRYEQNRGVAGALNHGIEACRAPLIARHDGDDMSPVTRLEVQKAFLDARPETAICGTGMYVIDEDNKLMNEIHHPVDYESIRAFLRTTGCPFVHGSVLVRAEALRKLGGYSTAKEFRVVEDYELWVRMAVEHRMENIPNRALYFHRHHPHKIGVRYMKEQARATLRVRDMAAATLA